MEEINSNDYELLYMIYQMDEDSLQCLVDKYIETAQNEIFYFLNMSPFETKGEELMQECIRILYESVYTYRIDKGTTFRTFYHHVLHNMMINYCRSKYTYEGICERTMLSLDEMLVEDSMCLLDLIPNQDITLEGIKCIDEEAIRYEFKKMAKTYKPVEMFILYLRLHGWSYNDIAKELKVENRAVGYVLRKMRKNKGFID